MSTTIESLQLEIKANSTNAKKGIEALTRSLTELKKATSGGLGLSAVTDEIKGLGDAGEDASKVTDSLSDSNEKLSDSNKKTSLSFKDVFSKAKIVVGVIKEVGRAIWSNVEKSNDYIETLNLFNVSMGEYAGEAREYAETVSSVMGIDTQEWMESQGVLMTLATGFGVASDRAAVMSKNLTQLGYDLSSFYNEDIDTMMQKIGSGLAGELEPLRRIGYDLSQAKLQSVASDLGIQKSLADMTQAEKAQLRYYAIMTQVTNAHGDMARTLDDPANQVRVLTAQIEMAGRAIGNIFIPALRAILPYAIAVTKVVREAAEALAQLVGYEEPTTDTSGITAMSSAAESTSEAMDDATKSAKKLKSYMLGFDELNVINPNSGSEDDNGLGGFDFELPDYTEKFLEDLSTTKIDGLVESIKELFAPLKHVADVTVEWASTLDVTPLIDKAKGAMSEWLNLMKLEYRDLGWVYQEILLPIIGWLLQSGLPAFLETVRKLIRFVATGIRETSENIKGLKEVLEPIVEWIGGVAITIIDSFGEAFDKLSAMLEGKGGNIRKTIEGIGTIISVVWNGIKPILKAVVSLMKWVFEIVTDDLIATGGLIIDTVAGIVEFIAGVFTGDWERAWDGVCMIFAGVWDYIKQVVINAWENTVLYFTTMYNFIVTLFTPLATWFDEKVIQPIVNFFAPMVEWISTFFEGCWILIQATWKGASTWFKNTVVDPIVNAFSPISESIRGYFSALWEGIKADWSGAVTWFDETVIQPLTSAFNICKDKIQEVFKALWQGVKVDVVTAMNWVIEKIEQAINWVIGGINGLISAFNQLVEVAAEALNQSWSGLSYVQEVSISRIAIPTYAEGGFPEHGQMFIAREAGAEMVGNIGRRTAVANNDQIVGGIASGVAEANEEQNALLREQNSLLRALLDKDSGVYLDGKRLSNSVEKYQRERGRVIVAGGVI